MIILLVFYLATESQIQPQTRDICRGQTGYIMSTAREAVAAAEFPARRHREGHSQLVMSWNTLSHFYFECFNCNAALLLLVLNADGETDPARCSHLYNIYMNIIHTRRSCAAAPAFLSQSLLRRRTKAPQQKQQHKSWASKLEPGIHTERVRSNKESYFPRGVSSFVILFFISWIIYDKITQQIHHHFWSKIFILACQAVF